MNTQETIIQLKELKLKGMANTLESLIGKNGVDCYSKNGHAVTVLTRQS